MGLKDKLSQKEFVILAEMEPPKGVDVSKMVNNAIKVKGKVDAFVVPEMSNAVMRMSSLGGALILQAIGMETVMQVCCRDRNRIALQADLLAGYASGISNVMAVTGEDPSFGDHHKARAVNDIDLNELLHGIQTLQNGRDMAGIELSGAPQFTVGSTVNPGAKGQFLDDELEEMKRKIEGGAQFFVTPPLFDLSFIKPFLEQVDLGRDNIIPTILLLKSVGMTRYIERNVSHIFIPESLIEGLQKTPDKEKECIRIAAEMARLLKQEGFGGIMIATIGWEHKLADILERAGF